jgi:hypothetical protein
MPYELSKSKLQSYRQCEKRLWLEINRPEEAVVGEIAKLKFNQGNAFGEAVRTLFPAGKLIDARNPELAVQQTADLWEGFNAGVDRVPVFEAAFAFDQVVIYADILEPARDGTWSLIELKSGTFKSNEGPKPHYVRDAAIQAWVLQQCGIKLSRIELGQPNAEFVLPADGRLEGLLKRVDVTNLVLPQFEDIKQSVIDARDLLRLSTAPERSVGAHCKVPYDCPFIDHCTRTKLNADEHFIIPVWHLASGPTAKIVSELMSEGYRNLADVPEHKLKKPIHRIMSSISKGAEPLYLDPSLLEHLRSQPFPRYFLDYETSNSPLPLWSGVCPGEQVPFQFSVHKWTALEGPVEHRFFLAETREDPRRTLAKHLADFVVEPGPVYAWNGKSTEGPITEKLAALCPEQSNTLLRIASSCRENDPIVYFREWFYHPLLSGNWGLKAIARAMLEMSPYENLRIENGVDAMREYERFLVMPHSAERDNLRDDLLAYCGTDTDVMIQIWRRILTMGEQGATRCLN